MNRQTRSRLTATGAIACMCGSRQPVGLCTLCGPVQNPANDTLLLRGGIESCDNLQGLINNDQTCCGFVNGHAATCTHRGNDDGEREPTPAPPPAEQLPPGWRRDDVNGHERYLHDSGAWARDMNPGDSRRWRAGQTMQSNCDGGRFDSRNLAMCAALDIDIYECHGGWSGFKSCVFGAIGAFPTADAAALAALHAHAAPSRVAEQEPQATESAQGRAAWSDAGWRELPEDEWPNDHRGNDYNRVLALHEHESGARVICVQKLHTSTPIAPTWSFALAGRNYWGAYHQCLSLEDGKRLVHHHRRRARAPWWLVHS